MQAKFDIDDKSFRQAQFAVERQIPQGTIKAKISSLFDFSLTYRTPLWFCKDRGLLSLGVHASELRK